MNFPTGLRKESKRIIPSLKIQGPLSEAQAKDFFLLKSTIRKIKLEGKEKKIKIIFEPRFIEKELYSFLKGDIKKDIVCRQLGQYRFDPTGERIICEFIRNCYSQNISGKLKEKLLPICKNCCKLRYKPLKETNMSGHSSLKLENISALRKGEAPKGLQLEFDINPGCNCNCIMCDGRLKKDPDFSYSNLEKYFPFFDNEIVHTIKILGGEPLIDKEGLLGFISACVKKGFRFILVTNGSLLTEDYIDKLVDAGLDEITISLDSDIPDQHDHIRGNKGTFASIINSINYLKSNYPSFIIRINTVIMRINLERIKSLLELADTRGVDTISFVELDKFCKNYEDLRLNEDDLKKLKHIKKDMENMVVKTKVYYFPNRRRKKGEESVPLCDYISKKIKIGPEGQIKPCEPCENTVKGIYLNKPLKEIFKSKKFQEIIAYYLDECGHDCNYACEDE